MRMHARDRGLRCTTTRPLRNGNRCDNADQLPGRISNEHDDRVRRNVDRCCSEQLSAGSALPAGGEGFSSCPNYAAPNLTISNGLAQLDVINVRFQGYVTPQGALAMRTGAGQRFEGQIDSQNMLKGRVIGACVYDATWRRSA